MQKQYDRITKCIRENKIRATKYELLLFYKLRFAGFRTVFQYPVVFSGNFVIADFFIKSKMLIIEVDGGYHRTVYQRTKDHVKDELYRSLGYNILRLRNEDVDTFDTKSIHSFRKTSRSNDFIDTETEKEKRVRRKRRDYLLQRKKKRE